LTRQERDRIPSELLAQLAIGKYIKLTRAERDRMSNSLLAGLVIGKDAVLDLGEIGRFEPELRMIIEMSLRER
jgi:hypothetical protein